MNEEELNVDAEETNEEVDTQEEETASDDTITQEELNEIIEARLARERKKHEKELEELKEEERLSKLSKDEREKAEQEKRLRELEEREKALEQKERLTEVREELSQRSLDAAFAPMLVADDAEGTLENTKVFESRWNAALEQAVKDAYAGETPKRNSGGTKAMTKDEILSIKDSQERITAIQNHPELFN